MNYKQFYVLYEMDFYFNLCAALVKPKKDIQ